MSGTGMERLVRWMRIVRLGTVPLIALNASVIAVSIAAGSPLPFAAAALIAFGLAVILVLTCAIGTLERTRELEARVRELDQARPCAHASAEPVDLFNPSTGERDGERVGWVCPDCNAELRAGWSPAKKVLRAEGGGSGGTWEAVSRAVELTASGSISAASLLSGTGSLSAKPRHLGGKRFTSSSGRCICPECQQAMREALSDAKARAAGHLKAAEHFAALANVGRKRCLSYCPVCAERDEREAPGGWKPWRQEHMCAVTDCPPFPDLPPDESEQR
jgi:rubredoxin